MAIVIEETDESLFWLEFTRDEKLIAYYDNIELEELIREADELVSIFISSRITALR